MIDLSPIGRTTAPTSYSVTVLLVMAVVAVAPGEVAEPARREPVVAVGERRVDRLTDAVQAVIFKRVNGQYRLTFRWEGNHAYQVRCEDDHA